MGRHKNKMYPIIEGDWRHAIPIAVAAEHWPVSKSVLWRKAQEGQIAAWKPGREWFVSILSLKRLYGQPQNGVELVEKLPHLL